MKTKLSTKLAAVAFVLLAATPAFAGKGGSAANPTYTISTMDGTESVTWTFDLSATKKPLVIDGMDLAGEWSASYFSIAGPDMEAIEEGNLVVSGEFKVYMKPQDARG